MDRLQVMNLVLTKLGEEEQLDDPDADVRNARTLNANWDGTRDLVLRAHVWNFAIDPKGTALTADAAYVPDLQADHTHRFLRPPDFIRWDLQRMRPGSLRREIRVGNRYVYASDAGPVLVSYVRRVEAVGEWDALFAEAFACRLAAQCARRIVGGDGGRAMQRDMMGDYVRALAEAKAVDGRENPPEEIEATDWELARYDGGNTYGDPMRWG